MSTSISFGGLASGLDTDSIISALVDVKETQLITPLETKITNLQTKSTSVASLKAAMANLRSGASTLQSASFTGRTANASDTDKVTLSTVDEAAAASDYSMYIDQMAQNDRFYFDGVADTDTTTFGTGTITITSDSVSKTVDIDSTNNTLQGIVDAINETAGMNVTASIVNDGSATNPYRLLLTSKDKGSTSSITTDIASVLTGLTEDATLNAAAENIGQDASIRVNSLTITSSTNSFTDAVPGVTFTINELETTTAITISVKEDLTSATSSLSTFVSYYNSVQDYFAGQFDFDEETGSSGILSSDFGIQSAYQRLKNITLGVFSDLGNTSYTSLASIGITLNSSNQLELDSDKLSDAISADLSQVKTLFQGTDSKDGLADQLYNFLDKMVDNTDGLLSEKINIYDETVDDLEDLIEDRQDRIEAYQTSLEEKYAYLETLMSAYDVQESLLEQFNDQLKAMANSN